MSKSNLSQSRFVQKSFNGITLSIVPDKTHEFLLTTAEVAKGYGVDDSVIRSSKRYHKDELLENEHWARSSNYMDKNRVIKYHADFEKYPQQIYWTKRGIIRLGFFIKSEKAKLFRDWIENLVIEKLNKSADCPGISQSFISRSEYHNLDIRSFQFDDTVYFAGDDAAAGLGRAVINVLVDEYGAWDYMKKFKIECEGSYGNFEYVPCISLEGLFLLIDNMRSSKARTFGAWLCHNFLDADTPNVETTDQVTNVINVKPELKTIKEDINELYDIFYLICAVNEKPSNSMSYRYKEGVRRMYNIFADKLEDLRNNINHMGN